MHINNVKPICLVLNAVSLLLRDNTGFGFFYPRDSSNFVRDLPFHFFSGVSYFYC